MIGGHRLYHVFGLYQSGVDLGKSQPEKNSTLSSLACSSLDLQTRCVTVNQGKVVDLMFRYGGDLFTSMIEILFNKN